MTGEAVRLKRVAMRGESQPTRELRGLREKKVFTLKELGSGLCTKQCHFHGFFFFFFFKLSETTLFCLKNRKENI